MKFTIAVITTLLVSTHGLPDLEGRILNGLPAEINEIPHQVALLLDFWFVGTYVHTCGASIIRTNAVVTAAQCVEELVPQQLQIRAGSKYHNSGGKVVQVEDIFSHPSFTRLLDFDIAVLFLDNRLDYGPTISPISLPNPGLVVAPGTYGIVSGWGRLSEEGEGTDHLQKSGVAFVNQTDCAYRLRMFRVVTDNMICAGNLNSDETDTCEGDTGGPLTLGANLAGIRSWGYGCGRNGFPGVYTRVSVFREWIDEILNNRTRLY